MKTVECTRSTQFEWFIVLFGINSLISEQFECLTNICTVSAFEADKVTYFSDCQNKEIDILFH